MKPFSLNIKGRLHSFSKAAVMGVINVTPDSFYARSRATSIDDVAKRAASMAAAGARLIDVGACSTRPGSIPPSQEEELRRLEYAIPAVREAVGHDILISVDTFRADVAAAAVGLWGADIVNDVSCAADHDMIDTVAQLHCPYILTHSRGDAASMARLNDYPQGVTFHIVKELSLALHRLLDEGVADVIVDPGFGFAKDILQNFELLAQLETLDVLDKPILVGVSRKSMITKLLGIQPDDALAATAVTGALAVERGASILRVHDVVEAVQAVEIVEKLNCRHNV